MAKKTDSAGGMVETDAEQIVEAEPAPVEAPPAEVATPVATPAPAPIVSGSRVISGTVKTAITVSNGGQMLRLNPGDFISEESYGPGIMERMRDAGVAFQ